MEVWLHGFSIPGKVTGLARRAEDWGFAGLLLADSQNLTADAWMELALAGAATSRLRLGTGVTNPITRHLAVTASAAATLQAETGGRAVVGFAQGDSALSQIGRRRLRVAEFEQAVQALQALLRAEAVDFDGTRSSIRWLASSELGKVPVHVAATGARTIAAGARHADGVDLTVGADPERLRWGAATAREAAPAGGSLSVGAYVNVAVVADRHQARDQARELVRGSVATFARFSGQAPGDYQPDRHGQSAAAVAQELDAGFIDRFAVCGPPQLVRDRLGEIAACGIDRLIVVPCSLDAPTEAVEHSNELFATEVLARM